MRLLKENPKLLAQLENQGNLHATLAEIQERYVDEEVRRIQEVRLTPENEAKSYPERVNLAEKAKQAAREALIQELREELGWQGATKGPRLPP